MPRARRDPAPVAREVVAEALQPDPGEAQTTELQAAWALARRRKLGPYRLDARLAIAKGISLRWCAPASASMWPERWWTVNCPNQPVAPGLARTRPDDTTGFSALFSNNQWRQR